MGEDTLPVPAGGIALTKPTQQTDLSVFIFYGQIFLSGQFFLQNHFFPSVTSILVAISPVNSMIMALELNIGWVAII